MDRSDWYYLIGKVLELGSLLFLWWIVSVLVGSYVDAYCITESDMRSIMVLFGLSVFGFVCGGILCARGVMGDD